MFRKRTNGLLLIVLPIAIVLAFSSCEKLKVSKLKANYHFSKANKLFTDNKYRPAIAEYEATLANDPARVEAYRFLGECYKQLYKPGDTSKDNKEKEEKALAALKKAYEIEPTNKNVIYSLGDMYDKLRNFKEAEKLYVQIVELEPGNMNNYYVVAEFYKRYAGENKEVEKKAESMYLRRIEADPDNPLGYSYLASYYQDAVTPSPEVYDKANEYWDKRIQLQPNAADAWLAKGVNRWSRAYRWQNLPAEERLRSAQEGLRALLKAKELDPDYPEPHMWLSVLYQSVLVKLEPDKEARYKAEADQAIEKSKELRKRAAEKKKLEEELKK